MSPSKNSNPYPDFLVRNGVIWPKAHVSKLQDEYKGSSREELDAEDNHRKHHHPLKGSITSSQRQAGTSGSSYSHGGHPDDFDHVYDNDDNEAKQELEGVLSDSNGKYTSKLTQEQRDELLKCIRDAGRPEDIREDLKKLLDNPDIVISARTLKELTPDFGNIESHKKAHGWARYILPVCLQSVGHHLHRVDMLTCFLHPSSNDRSRKMN
jgi:hypothetical protein